MDSYTCGHYALLFLKAKARNVSLQDFLAQWNSHNLVINDRRAGEQIQRLIKTELTGKDLSCQLTVVFVIFINKNVVKISVSFIFTVMSMITRQDKRQVNDALTLAAILYFSQHPFELLSQDQWDGFYWKRVAYFSQQQVWKEWVKPI